MKKRVAGLGISAILLLLAAFVRPTGDLTVEGFQSLMIFLMSIVLMICGSLPVSLSALVSLCCLGFFGITSMVGAFESIGIYIMMIMIGVYSTTTAMASTTVPTRIANLMVKWSRGNSKILVLLFGFASAIVSSLMSNFATMGIFVGVVLKVIDAQGANQNPGKSNLARDLMIMIAAGSGVGGFGTPVGVTSNMSAIAMMESVTGTSVNFAQWTAVGYPIMFVTVILTWLVLMFLFPPEPITGDLANINSADLGKMTPREIKAMVILVLMLVGWFAGSWVPWCNTATVAMVGTALFMLPGIEVFSWKEFNDTVGWDCVLMCGTILGIVAFVQSTGASDWIVNLMLQSVGTLPAILAILCMSVIACVLHALIPNGLPVLTLVIVPFVSLCVSLDINPAIGLMVGTFWCDWAPILPIDALPAMGYATGHYEAQEYVKQGIIVSLISMVLLTALTPLLCNVFMSGAMA